MLIPPKYILTPSISLSLQKIDAAKSVIDAITIPPEIETNIKRQSLLKSSLFSARIEGNPLTLEEVSARPSKDQKKVEVYNILKATQFLRTRGARDLSVSFVKELHKKTMTGLIEKSDLGTFRTEVNAIFNQAGIAVYLPPSPRSVPSLMEKLLVYCNSTKEQFVPIRAVLAHYTFEKIHPFIDGNGRVGRLIMQAVMEKAGYGMKGLLSLEEYLDRNRSDYYDGFMQPERDVTGYVEFMLEGLSETAEKAKELVLKNQTVKAEDYLLPRRAEILNIIKDHKLVNFDFIRRRFMRVNERTLRYDLKQLQNAELIRKLGTTKGVYYSITEKSKAL